MPGCFFLYFWTKPPLPLLDCFCFSACIEVWKAREEQLLGLVVGVDEKAPWEMKEVLRQKDRRPATLHIEAANIVAVIVVFMSSY